VRLQQYVDFLIKNNAKINLIGKNTTADIWHRHIFDSAQILQHLPKDTKRVIDIGTGAGLPGIILSILGIEEVDLVESITKKANFLREAAQFSPNKINVFNDRAEDLIAWESDVVTSRACAPLDKLLGFTEKLIAKSKICVFLKGRNVEEEILQAKNTWSFDYDLAKSLTAEDSYIIKINNVKHL
jgi:16S rRNA (guanine527-N7)-methyltransferase